MNRRTLKLVLASVLAVGALGSVTVHGVFAVFSSQTNNVGGSIASGTLTMENANGASGASTTLSGGVGATALAAAVPETKLTANVPAAFPTTTLAAAVTTPTVTSITVASASGFPTSGNYTITIGTEQMTVTGGWGTTTWTVTRGVNGTTAATHANAASVAQVSISVSSAAGFPASGSYTVLVDSEQMTVTAGQGTNLWTVTRAANGTTAAVHSTGATVDPTTISVSSYANFPASGNYPIRVGNEVMTVTGGQGTATWTVTRGANGTAIASHSSGASVLQKTVKVSSASGFPAGGDYTVLVDSERMLVTGGQGTTTWTVVRAVDGTSSATHASGAAIATPACKTVNGTANVNTGCDAVLAWAPDSESYPGTPVTTSVAIADTGSLAASDLLAYMPSCLRAVTPDAPFAAAAPSISSFGSASSSGGSLVGGTTYYYEVTSVTGTTESVAGSESSYTPPTGTSTNQVTLNWPAVAGATGYKIYRSTSEGGEKLLASVGAVTSYADNTAASPAGSPPSGAGSGNPCLTGGAQLSIQETNASGTATKCWYPTTATTCTFSGTSDLGAFTSHQTSATALDLGAGPTATGTRYFQIGVQLPSTAANALQGTGAAFTLHWYALS